MDSESIPLTPALKAQEDRDEEEHEDIESAPLIVGSEEEANMGSDEQYTRAEGREGDTVALIGAVLFAGALVIMTWVMVFLNNPMSLGWFFWHPTLQSLAFGAFTYGILTLQPTMQPKTKLAGLRRHQLIMLAVGLPSITLGTFAIWWNKHIGSAHHAATWHGLLGYITVGWLLLQVLLGGGSVWFNGRLVGGNHRAKLVWKYHRLSGYLLFLLLLLTTHLGGAWSNWAAVNSPLVVRWIAYIIAPVVILAAILMRIRWLKMRLL
ncbi:uncharacterized protein LAESUDRAFT_729101 [Laetiporus sulphureus 93-53]|uniref:Cytochrome b561 domain-containing protein n=1 Tax=Laetiporus sulphureus 93-53 TaxID=1314785 RepID=A0A165CVP4_9APHY|nr:uncharacterized protein LAESUDRAFT_729101 [Laetiporus sulphureus 93-53]KZT03516.1 hypothetical protein LAESUDRAFT_729101 [Laetiporus sulphureus 93-53]